MKTRGISLCILRGGLTTLTLCVTIVARAQYAYDITPIAGSPYSINNYGQVVGTYFPTNSQQNRSFEYSNGQFTDLFPNDIGGSSANAINDRGQIAGGNSTGPYFYDSKTGATQSLGLTTHDYANAINQNGLVAGTYQVGGFAPSHAYIYSIGTGKFQDLSSTIGNTKTATGINSSGQVTGDTVIGNAAQAYLYSNGVTQGLGTLPGDDYSEGTGINDSGAVIGDSGNLDDNKPDHAFLYRNGKMTDIGVLINAQASSSADGINNAGDVVGEANFTGFLYHNGSAQYLNNLIDPSLGWNTLRGVAINDQGQIIGSGNFGGFLMTPHSAAVPAPSSLLTFGMGAGLMLLAARRRRRNAAPRP